MVQNGQITLYTSTVNYARTWPVYIKLTLLVQYTPYGHRVRLALEEANAKYTLHEVDTMNKPAYFTEKVNPLGKVRSLVSCSFQEPLTNTLRSRSQRSPTVVPRQHLSSPRMSL